MKKGFVGQTLHLFTEPKRLAVRAGTVLLAGHDRRFIKHNFHCVVLPGS